MTIRRSECEGVRLLRAAAFHFNREAVRGRTRIALALSLQEAKVFLLLLDSRHMVRSGRSRIPGRALFVNMSRFNRSLCLVNRLHSFFTLPVKQLRTLRALS